MLDIRHLSGREKYELPRPPWTSTIDIDFGGKNTARYNLQEYIPLSDEGSSTWASPQFNLIKKATPLRWASEYGCTATERFTYMPFLFAIQGGSNMQHFVCKKEQLMFGSAAMTKSSFEAG